MLIHILYISVVFLYYNIESKYCFVVLVISFVCYAYVCEIARIGKPCVVAIHILSLTFSFALFIFMTIH